MVIRDFLVDFFRALIFGGGASAAELAPEKE